MFTECCIGRILRLSFSTFGRKKTPSFFCTIEEEWTPSFKLPSPLIRPHNPSLSALISSNFTSIHFGPVSSEIYYLTTQGTSRKRFITVQGRTESKSMQKCIKVRTGCRQHGTCSALHSLHDLTGPRNTTTVSLVKHVLNQAIGGAVKAFLANILS